MSLEGQDGIQKRMRELAERMRARGADAADELSQKLATTAKSIGPWTDRTGNLRNSIKGSYAATAEGFTIVVSESMSYAPFVEEGTRRSAPYPSLWPAVAENQTAAMEIFKRHLEL